MKNQAIGYSVSIMIHSLFGLLFLAGGASIVSNPGTIAINFSLLPPSPATSQAVQPKAIQNREPAKIKKRAPAPAPKPQAKLKQDIPQVVIPEEIPKPVEAEDIIQNKPVPQEANEPLPQAEVIQADTDNTPPAEQETAAVQSSAPSFQATDSRETLGAIYHKKNFNYIKDGIQQNVIYPRQARMMGWQGRVILSFTINADGRVEGITVKESSGFALLDKKAIETVRKAAPFPSPPVPAELTIPIVFNLV